MQSAHATQLRNILAVLTGAIVQMSNIAFRHVIPEERMVEKN